MKKLLVCLMAVFCLFLVACGGGNSGNEYDKIPDTMESADGKYEIAFVTDIGQLKDKSFNQGTWEGIKKYANDNSKSYKYKKCV